jgi:F-type H+-transporting ATPase subunit a
MSTGYLFIEKPMTTAFAISGSLIALSFFGRRALDKAQNKYLPDVSFGIKSVFETLALFIVWLGDMVMGKENRKYLPFLAVLFLFILISNLIGLVPGIPIYTDQMHFNLGMALVVFGLYNYWAIRETGISGFLKHLWGPIWWLGFLLFPIEVVSHLIRPAALSIRLFGNLFADHTVLSIFNGLTGGTWYFFLAVPFYFLGMIVCLVQAFVFTLLTMVYIRLGVVHEGH